MPRSHFPMLPAAFVAIASLSLFTACEKKQPATAPKVDDHAHAPGDGHASHDAPAPGHGGAVIQLGETAIGSFTAKVSRDEGQIVAGKDAPIDVTVTPGAGSTTKAVAVRFWIGTKDAKGSVKAKAEVENPKDPNRWHTHAEVPNPIPEGSMLWVEIEDEQGATSVGNFGLKM
jgi:hypothetical protein